MQPRCKDDAANEAALQVRALAFMGPGEGRVKEPPQQIKEWIQL